MIEGINIFLIGFTFSFLGSIPPGTINLSIFHLSSAGYLKSALQFSLAASIVEILYSFIAIKFQLIILSNDNLKTSLHIISAFVMIILGIVNLISSSEKNPKIQSHAPNGFLKGLLICLLNPFLIPFWVITTTYLTANNWFDLSSYSKIASYIAGISTGASALHTAISLLAYKFSDLNISRSLMSNGIGIIFTGLGILALFNI